jgi:outer membrane translocation and assembly module TamA
VRSGYEQNLNNLTGSGIPVSNAFFLGGYTTVRGYTGNGNDRIPSNNQFPLTSNFNQLVVPKESDYVLLKSELRFPIREPLGAVLFWDAGQVNIQKYNFMDPFKQSVGVGLRVNTPLGPISLDYGHKLNPETGQSNYAWHLFIGTF